MEVNGTNENHDSVPGGTNCVKNGTMSPVQNGQMDKPMDRSSAALLKETLHRQASIKRRKEMQRQESLASNRDALERQYSTGSTGSTRETGQEMVEKDYRRLQNEMQMMTFKVRALDEKVEKVLKERGMNIEEGLGKGVAFTARLTDHMTIGSYQNVIFDDVVTNVGDGYNPETGIFKAPYTARYLFTLTVKAQDKKQINAEIVNDPLVLGQVATGDTSTDRATASTTVVASLDVGDEVCVRQKKTWTGHFFGEGYTIFTGILLQ